MYAHIPKTLWEKWTPANERNQIQLACRTLFLQTDCGRNILFDVGAGDFFEPKFKERYGIEGESNLISSLAQMGIAEKDVDTVIVSHLHFDHAGGLLSAYNQGVPRLRFPCATYYLSRAQWECASAPHLRERASFIPLLISLLAQSGRLIQIEKTTHPNLNFGLNLGFSDGHTMGMMLSYLNVPSGLLVYASDLVPGMPWVHLPATTGYDRYPELVVNEKQKLLEQLVQNNGRIVFTHDLETSCAYIRQDANGKYRAEPSCL